MCGDLNICFCSPIALLSCCFTIFCHFILQNRCSDSHVKNAQTSGLSWIKPGSIQLFSRQDSADTTCI